VRPTQKCRQCLHFFLVDHELGKLTHIFEVTDGISLCARKFRLDVTGKVFNKLRAVACVFDNYFADGFRRAVLRWKCRPAIVSWQAKSASVLAFYYGIRQIFFQCILCNIPRQPGAENGRTAARRQRPAFLGARFAAGKQNLLPNSCAARRKNTATPKWGGLGIFFVVAQGDRTLPYFVALL
jgi:hypothetical protein